MTDNAAQMPWQGFELPIADPTAVRQSFTQEQLIAMVRAIARKRNGDTELATLFDVEQMVRAQFARHSARDAIQLSPYPPRPE